MRRIGANHGIDAARKALKNVLSTTNIPWERLFAKPGEQHPQHGELEGTLHKLVEGHNELTDGAVLARLAGLEARVTALEGDEPPPPPDPEPEPTGYAPRAYNSTPSADARFCMDGKYGVVPDGAGYRDAKGVLYDQAGRDLGGRTKDIVPELKGANSMDGKEPCDEYVGPTGVTVGGAAGYPAASFRR